MCRTLCKDSTYDTGWAAIVVNTSPLTKVTGEITVYYSIRFLRVMPLLFVIHVIFRTLQSVGTVVKDKVTRWNAGDTLNGVARIH